jgi:hypothetical protein
MDLHEPLVINDPDTYQAFYGILRGDPDVFGVKKKAKFFLDLQLFFPDCDDAATELTL